MTTHGNAEDWDDWEDEDASHDAPRAALARAPASPLSADASLVADTAPDLPVYADEDEEESDDDQHPASWTWNLQHMETDLLHLPPLATKPSIAASSPGASSQSQDESALFEHVLSVAELAASSIHAGRERVVTLEALALVAKLHALSVRSAFSVELATGAAEHEVPTIVERLHEISGDWGAAAHLSDEIPALERQHIQEMSSLLHHALASCDGDLSPFQQVVEQLFASLPGHRLSISVTWIRPSAVPAFNANASSVGVDPLLLASSYLQHLQSVADPTLAPEKIVAVLTEAEVFQDSKDIKRDELVINGEFVAGTVGYNAIVDSLQHQIQDVLRTQVGKEELGARGQYADTTRDIAKQILNACNRTESGGSSYEILGKFLSNHEMDAVLIRPDSAKAAPLEIRLDVGAFLEQSSSGNNEMWAFGVRAVLSAVTWYLVCDADDPTNELYEVKTTYQNRLAFPLGLTPFHPLNSMRKDCGSVEIQLLSYSRISN